ncbi:MAG: hypothetical protein AAGA54_27830 [Myxococcota bacterium]
MLVAFLCAAACDSDGGDLTDQMPDDLPAGQCDTEGTSTGGCDTDASTSTAMSTTGAAADGSSSTGGPDGSCVGTDTCLGAGVCSATWDAQTQRPGPASCNFACVANFDDARWCADDDACCEPGATCTDRGYCVPGDGGDATGSSSSGSGGDTDAGESR